MITKPRHYADGGKVQLPGPETRKLPPRPPMPPPKKGPKPKKLADGGKITSGKASKKGPLMTGGRRIEPIPRRRSTVDIMRGKTRRENEEALGLKDGGKVKRKKRY